MEMDTMKKVIGLIIASACALAASSGWAQDAINVDASGRVGVGTASPTSAMHLRRSDGTAQILVEETAATPLRRTLFRLVNSGGAEFRIRDNSAFGGSGFEWSFQNVNAEFRITTVGDPTNEFLLDRFGNLTVTGTLTTTGPTCGGGCDEVLSPSFRLEPIEEHAQGMRELGHLPMVGKTTPGLPFDLTQKTGGILNELEKAHLYIEQLHQRLAMQQRQIDELAAAVAALNTR
jgi:hypothetical protein